MVRITSPLVAAWPRLTLITALAAIVVLVALTVAALADGALMASAPASDGPLLAPFRWTPLASNLS